MKTRPYSVFKDAIFPIDKILKSSYNIALSELWMERKEDTYRALFELESHSIIWDFAEIKKIFGIINYHILYQENFSCEISLRDGFETELEKASFKTRYVSLSRKQLLFLILILCDDIVLEEYPSDKVFIDGDSTVIKTENYTLRLQNPKIGMPGTKFEFLVPGKFEMKLFAYKS